MSKITPDMYEIVRRMGSAIETRIPTFLLSGRIRHYERSDVFKMMMYTSRILNANYTVYIIGAGQSPDEIEEKITSYLVHNYLVLVCGLEFVPVDTIVRILFVATSFMHKSGEFRGRGAFGGLIFFLPILSQNEGGLKITAKAQKILDMFYQREELIFDAHIEASYAEYTKFSKEVAEMAKFISCLEYQYPNIVPTDVPFILQRVSDQNDPVQDANSIYAQLSHQCMPSVSSSIKYLIRGCFDLPEDKISDSIDQFKTQANYPLLSKEGNFTFELLQYYVRQSITALVGKNQQLSQLLASFLAKVNNWKLYWVTSLRDLEEKIHDIEKHPDQSLLVFCFQQIDEIMAKSMYKTILQLQVPHQPIELNHKYHFVHGLKILAIMNRFEDKQVMETPLALIQHRILVNSDLLDLNYSIKNAILNRISLHFEKPQLENHQF